MCPSVPRERILEQNGTEQECGCDEQFVSLALSCFRVLLLCVPPCVISFGEIFERLNLHTSMLSMTLVETFAFKMFAPFRLDFFTLRPVVNEIRVGWRRIVSKL